MIVEQLPFTKIRCICTSCIYMYMFIYMYMYIHCIFTYILTVYVHVQCTLCLLLHNYIHIVCVCVCDGQISTLAEGRQWSIETSSARHHRVQTAPSRQPDSFQGVENNPAMMSM